MEVRLTNEGALPDDWLQQQHSTTNSAWKLVSASKMLIAVQKSDQDPVFPQ